MNAHELDFYRRLISGLAKHFGPTCEIVLFDLDAKDQDHFIAAIENGQVTGRKAGDGMSHIVLETIKNGNAKKLEDRLAYLTKTKDGKILKSSTIYLRGDEGEPIGILAINSDITLSVSMEQYLHNFNATDLNEAEPEAITRNVSDLLDELIDESVRIVGKPAALMGKADKIKAIRFLNDSGAFLITKSGPKVCSYFGISKYTLYSYLDEAKTLPADNE
ncbi:MAG: helix-turn-helix transcriptional regulator [Lachnospiraceae bacterium]|nr:helix-turn-helix transcriptional regulator [Lachnospiraceae bacterium]